MTDDELKELVGDIAQRAGKSKKPTSNSGGNSGVGKADRRTREKFEALTKGWPCLR